MIKNIYIFIRNFVLLILVCNTLYWYFPFRPVVWRILLLLSAGFLIFFKEKKLLACEKAVLVFTAFNFLHFFLSFLWSNPNITQIGNILCAMLTMSLFACLSEKGVMTDKFIAIAGVVLVIASVPYYYHSQAEILEKLSAGRDKDVTNNASSIFLMLLPIVFLLKNNIQKWGTLMVCLFFILLSAKRGNILAAALPTILFAYTAIKGEKRSELKTIVVIIAIVAAGYLVYVWSINNNYLMYRLEQTAEGDSSRRDVIYSNAWEAWYYTNNILILFFGYGFDATEAVKNIGHAHSDWLEILVDYGLLGVAIYLIVFYSLYKQICRTRSIELRMALISTVLIWFFKSVYSMGFTEVNMPLLMLTLGTVLGKYKRGEVAT